MSRRVGVQGPATTGAVTRGGGEVVVLERELELALIQEWITDAVDGRGRIALVRAGAGLGKSTLLGRAAVLAEQNGMTVLTARASELEREMPFGVARQLFEGPLRRLDLVEQAAVLAGAAAHTRSLLGLSGVSAGSGDPLGVIHGLYWLLGNLSDRGALMLAIDDLHWVDAQTGRWLSYLGARVAELPVLVLAAARSAEPDAAPTVAGIGDRADSPTIELHPLRVAAVAQLVSMHAGRSGEEQFVAACHRATRGNPYFLRELLRAATADGLEPVAANVRLVPELGTRAISESIVARLARLGRAASKLADAAAVLGSDASLGATAQLAALEREEALAAWDALIGGDILEPGQPLVFIHPIARTAIYHAIAPGERTRAHRQAAAILDRAGATPDRVAAHALQCEPAADPSVVGWLRAAAAEALRGGAPDAAANSLRRALSEPPAPEIRAQLEFELGRALIGLDSGAAALAFEEAAKKGSWSQRRTARRLQAFALAFAGRMHDALEAYESAIELAGGDSEEVLHLAGRRDFYAMWWPSDPDHERRRRELRELAGTLSGASPGELQVLGAAAVSAIHDGTAPASWLLEIASKLSQSKPNWLEPDGDVTPAAIAFIELICDPAAAADLYERVAIPECAREGRAIDLSFAHTSLAITRFRLGGLLDGEASARTAWDIIRTVGPAADVVYWWAAAALIEILIARGNLSEAAALFDAPGIRARTPSVLIHPWPPVLRGELMLAEGRAAEGVNLLLEAGDWLEERGFTNPGYIPWRARAAPALVALGRREEAWAVIEPAMERARAFGVPWALGMTLCAAGTVAQGQRGMALLREAIDVLEDSPCRLEHAHALLELGALLRRTNQRTEARECLALARDMAHRCGAIPLRARAERELRTTGARPRRVMLTGPESLTASERRVAELAARGLSNPEIAQQLFVSRKTIETHLRHTYQKLGVASRQQLATALGDGDRETSDARDMHVEQGICPPS